MSEEQETVQKKETPQPTVLQFASREQMELKAHLERQQKRQALKAALPTKPLRVRFKKKSYIDGRIYEKGEEAVLSRGKLFSPVSMECLDNIKLPS